MRAVHRHHRKRRSQGGDDSYGNLIELPPEVHELVHREPAKAYEHGLLVHSYDDPGAIRPDVVGFLTALDAEIIPVPMTVAGKPKRRNYEKDSQERRQRKRISVAVPADTEDGGAIWDDTIDRVKQRLVELGLYEEGSKPPVYECVVAALQDWLDNWTYT